MKRTIKLAILVGACMALAMALLACGTSEPVSRSAAESFANVNSAAEKTMTATNVYGETVSTEPEGVKYLLVIGDDAWENYTPGHADMNCLLRIDFDNHQITEITIPRDTKYTMSDGTVIKVMHIMPTRGVEEMVKAESDVYGHKIDFYARVGFDDLQALVDGFGGLSVDLPYPIDYHFYTNDFDDEHIDEGTQTINGWQAMVASRSRVSYGELDLYPDVVRQYVCRMMLNSLMQVAYADGSKTGDLLKSLQGHVESNLPVDAQVAWAEKLGEAGTINITQVTGPFYGGDDEELGDWAIPFDANGWANLNNAVENSGDLSAVLETYEGADRYPEGFSFPIISTITVG